MRVITFDNRLLSTQSYEMKGPLPFQYLRQIQEICETKNGVYLAGIQIGDRRCFAVPAPHFSKFPVLYNPRIIDKYDEVKETEGCLSFPGLYPRILRYRFVDVEYRDGNWDLKREVIGSEEDEEQDLLAKAIQHEVAHMTGECLVHRIYDTKQYIKFKAAVAQAYIKQGRSGMRYQLEPGPAELNPEELPKPEKKSEPQDAIPGGSTPQEPPNIAGSHSGELPASV